MESGANALLNMAAIGIDFCTGATILLGVALEVMRLSRAAISGLSAGFSAALREVRFSLGQWLAFSLELALAADILRTVVVPTWDEIGKLGAIVVLRTVLNYFLGKEISEAGAARLAGTASA